MCKLFNCVFLVNAIVSRFPSKVMVEVRIYWIYRSVFLPGNTIPTYCLKFICTWSAELPMKCGTVNTLIIAILKQNKVDRMDNVGSNEMHGIYELHIYNI